jgi:hypothetical protein
MSQTIRINHYVQLVPQPNNVTCWSAATSMVLGSRSSIGAGSAATTPRGALIAKFPNVASFARGHGLTMYGPQTWSIEGLISLLKRGPVVMMGNRPTGHAVVIAGIRSDGTAEHTYLTIYDPWPVGRGRVSSGVSYVRMMRRFPLTTRYMLQRSRGVRYRTIRAVNSTSARD